MKKFQEQTFTKFLQLDSMGNTDEDTQPQTPNEIKELNWKRTKCITYKTTGMKLENFQVFELGSTSDRDTVIEVR